MSDITDKIGALLAQAEGTTNEHERDAFTAKAQALATTYAIDLELARQRQSVKTERETPTISRITIKAGGRNNQRHFCQLIMAIGRVNDLTFNIAHNNSYVEAFGFPSDIEVTERLYASLSVQMVQAADHAIDGGEHKLPENLYWSEGRYVTKRVPCPRSSSEECYECRWGYKHERTEWRDGQHRADARVFRTSFYEGFISRLSARLQEAKKEAEQQPVITVDEAGSEVVTTGALVLVGKREQVQDYYKQKSTARGSWAGYKSNGSSSFGAIEAGRRAANSASLHGPRGSLPGPRRAIA